MASKGKGKSNSKAQVKEIIQQLEDGMQELFTTEKFAEYLRVMSRFSKYSPRNVRLIHMQMPGASMVAGYQAWQTKFGRYVKRGEMGIRILAPTPFTIQTEKQKLDPDTRQPILGKDGLPVTEMVEERIPRFKVIPVFDVSQTDGKPLPQLAEDLPGDVQHFELFLDALRAVSPLPIKMEPLEGKDGTCRFGVEIAIKEGMGEIQTVCAAVHEIGHAKLHDPTWMPEKEKKALEKKSSRTKEVEAEAVAYVVCQYYGIETSPNSFGYIAAWSKDMELKELNASLGTISRTASELIEGIDGKFRELAKERGIVLASPEAFLPVEPGESMAPEHSEQTVQAAFDRLIPGELVYMAAAQKPVMLMNIRETDVLFVAPELAVEITQTREQVLQGLRENSKNRHLLDLAAAELKPPDTMREEPAAPTPEKEYDLGFGHFGNGLAVWNRLEEQDGDYVKVAHIGPDRSVTIYDQDMPESIRAQIEQEARTSEITVSATQDAPVFDTPPEGREPDVTANTELMPDPAIGLSQRDQFGYTQADMLPVTMERALELYDQDLTVYMLSPDNTEAMAFDRAEIEAHDGMFGVDAAEWRESPECSRMAATENEAARETAFLEGKGDAYGVYQLKDGDDLRHHRWTGLEQLSKDGLTVDRANYNLVYTAPLEPGMALENLYVLHNRDDRPAGQDIRSMSISDIVALRQDGEISSHYVDRDGFTQLPSFLGVERQPEPPPPTYSQVGNTLEHPSVPDGPSVAELEAKVKGGQQISLHDVANAVKRERQPASGKAKPSILAQLQERKKTAAQGGDSSKMTPKRDSNREV